MRIKILGLLGTTLTSLIGIYTPRRVIEALSCVKKYHSAKQTDETKIRVNPVARFWKVLVNYRAREVSLVINAS